MSAIIRAIDLVGGQAALAKLCDVTPQAVHQWAHDVRPVPPKHALTIQRATEGVVTTAELRPDLAEIFAPAIPAKTVA